MRAHDTLAFVTLVYMENRMVIKRMEDIRTVIDKRRKKREGFIELREQTCCENPETIVLY